MLNSIFGFTLKVIILITLFNSNIFAVNKDQVVLEVGNEKFTYSDLEKAFSKNMNRNGKMLHEITNDSLMDFVNLFSNYRLKVADAKMKGLEKDSAVMSDLLQNRKVLSESFIFDRYLTEPYVNKVMERRKVEKKIALIQTVYMEGPLKDTLAAYNKAKEALQKVLDGEDFHEIARKYSEDPRSAPNGGIIDRFITGGLVARDLEDAVYATKKGDVYPNIIYNRNSYFVIKVIDEAERKFIRGSQILIAPMQAQFNEAAQIKADSIMTALKSGADFAYLAQLHSDDASSAINGGDLGDWYSRSTGFQLSPRTLLPEVENALYNLKEGQISSVIKSDVGFHIVRVDSIKIGNSYDDPNDIKVLYKRKYFTDDKEKFLDSLAIAYGYELKQNVLEEILSVVDTNITNAKVDWDKNISNSLRSKELFSYLKFKINVGEFINILNQQTSLRGISTNESGFIRAINKYIQPQIFDQASIDFEKQDKVFAELMKEFSDGILLFKIEADEVWNNLKFDTTRALKFYETNKNKYKTDPSYDISEIYIYDKNLADSLYNIIKSGADFDNIAANNTQRAGYREKNGNWGIQSIYKNELAKYAHNQKAEKGDILEPYKFNSAFSIVKVNEFYPIRTKSFEEAIPDFAPELQDILQKEISKNWIESIKSKVKVKIHEETLLKIKNELGK